MQQPTQQPVQLSQLKYEQDRRKKLADVLGKNADRQVGSHLDGLAKVLQMGMAGYQTRKSDEAGKQFEDAKREALAKALDGSVSRDERIKTLAGVPGYEGDAVKASLESAKAGDLKEQAESALIAQASGQPLTPEQTAALKAFDTLRQTERMYDPRQNIVPKFSPLLGGQAPAGGAPSPAPVRNMPQSDMPLVSQVPAGGLLPPPAAGQTPDASMFAPPPAGLDAKAQGQYMDAMAATAAERAANGGMPKMTAEQAQANVRGQVLGQSLQDLEQLMFDKDISPGRMATAKSISELPVVPKAASPFVQNSMMNPKEQLFDSAMAGAKESLAGALTGAAFTDQQAQNFTAMLPNGTEAPEIRKKKLENAYQYAIAVSQGAGAAGQAARQDFENSLRRLQQEQQTPAPAQAIKRLRFNPATGELE